MTDSSASQLTLALPSGQTVSALLMLPEGARALLVLAHGAGAGMQHPFMEAVAAGLAQRGLASLRYQFPYMERGSRRPDPPALCHATVRAAVAAARTAAPSLPLFAGGRSFGGRMTSQAQAAGPLAGVRGLVFLAFPLHPAGRPGDERAGHLSTVQVPMLFLQGTRDALAELPLISRVTRDLGPRATLAVIGDADHSYHVRVASGRNDTAVVGELLGEIGTWTRAVSART